MSSEDDHLMLETCRG